MKSTTASYLCHYFALLWIDLLAWIIRSQSITWDPTWTWPLWLSLGVIHDLWGFRTEGLVTQVQLCAVQPLPVWDEWLVKCLSSASHSSSAAACCSWIPNPNPVPLRRGQARSLPRLSLWMWGHLNLCRSWEELNEYPPSWGRITFPLIHLLTFCLSHVFSLPSH